MTTCPKCGRTDIIGPAYVQLVFGGEALRYTCATCGYSRDDPTKDASSVDGTRGLKGVFKEQP